MNLAATYCLDVSYLSICGCLSKSEVDTRLCFRGFGQGRGGGRGRGRGGGRGRGRGGRTEQGPSFMPEGKTWNDLTSEEKDDVTRQRNEWKAAQLDKDLVSFMAKGGKTDVAASLLDDDLEAYKRQGSKKKSEQPGAAQPDQQAAEPMEQ